MKTIYIALSGRWFLIVAALIFTSACRKSHEYISRAKPEFVIGPDDVRLTQASIHLSSDTVYVLAANIVRNAGQSLDIDPGTVIKVRDNLSITINEGAEINAAGTNTAPIVFTSATYTGGPGLQCGNCTSNHLWFGLYLHGNAAGSDPAKSSGTLAYVRIEFAGGDQNNVFPSLLLQNINSQTVIHDVQVSYSSFGPAFEFQGGNANVARLVSYASNRSDFFVHQGYHGNMQSLLAYRHPFFPNSLSGKYLAGLYIDGDSTTEPVISNMTVIGPDMQSGMNPDYSADPPQGRAALITTGGSKFHIRNSVFAGFPKAGFYIDEYSTAKWLHHEASSFDYSVVQCSDSSRAFYLLPGAYPPYNSDDFKNYKLHAEYHNELYLSTADFKWKNPYDYDHAPDPMPQAGSPLLQGADFSEIHFQDPFFQHVEYRGAIGADNWLQGWSNFLPLQTNYNQ